MRDWIPVNVSDNDNDVTFQVDKDTNSQVLIMAGLKKKKKSAESHPKHVIEGTIPTNLLPHELCRKASCSVITLLKPACGHKMGSGKSSASSKTL